MQGHAKKNLFMILILLSKRLMFNILNSEKNINLKITPFKNSRTANYFLNPIEYNQGKARIDGEQKVSGSHLHMSENIILGASSDCDISVNIPAPASHHQLPPHIQFVRKIMTYEDVTLFPFLVKKAW
jgi:hypothetical protein